MIGVHWAMVVVAVVSGGFEVSALQQTLVQRRRRSGHDWVLRHFLGVILGQKIVHHSKNWGFYGFLIIKGCTPYRCSQKNIIFRYLQRFQVLKAYPPWEMLGSKKSSDQILSFWCSTTLDNDILNPSSSSPSSPADLSTDQSTNRILEDRLHSTTMSTKLDSSFFSIERRCRTLLPSRNVLMS